MGEGPCPLCDIEDEGQPDLDGPWQPADILVLGVSLGAAFGVRGSTELVCDQHRLHWTMSMLKAKARLGKKG